MAFFSKKNLVCRTNTSSYNSTDSSPVTVDYLLTMLLRFNFLCVEKNCWYGIYTHMHDHLANYVIACNHNYYTHSCVYSRSSSLVLASARLALDYDSLQAHCTAITITLLSQLRIPWLCLGYTVKGWIRMFNYLTTEIMALYVSLIIPCTLLVFISSISLAHLSCG